MVDSARKSPDAGLQSSPAAAATLDPQQAARREWDAIVVGAGPAGTIAARQAARAGLSTLLVERKAFPRDKVCGACLNGRALATLENLGLSGSVAARRAVPLTQFQVRCGRAQTEIPLPGGAALSRSLFDAELARAAVEAGAEFLPQTTARLIGDETSALQRQVELRQCGQPAVTVSAKLVLLADGLGNSSLPRGAALRSRPAPASRVGIGGTVAECPSHFEPGTIYMAVGRAGYVGLVRVEANRLNIAAAVDPAAIGGPRGPAGAIASLLQSARFPRMAAFDAAEWSGTVPLTRRNVHPADHRVLLLGDAAGYVEPFTGEGMACALAGGSAAAELAARNVNCWSRESEREWLQLHRRLFDDRQQWCRRFARLLRHPWAIRAMLHAVSLAPQLARPIVRRLNDAPAIASEPLFASSFPRHPSVAAQPGSSGRTAESAESPR